MPEDLTAFIQHVTGESHSRVEEDLGNGFVRLRSEEAERRQAKHDVRGTEDIVIEMLRNARDAHASRIFVATTKEGTKRSLTMIDDGDGVPAGLRERIFEARVTSKLDTVHFDTWGIHGRGMALYAIKVNAQSARVVDTVEGGGTAISVVTDTESLPEKRDQSTAPIFVRTDVGTVTVRGPRNIRRTVYEFAYVDRSQVTVYLGSATDVAATLWTLGRQNTSATDRAFCTDLSALPVCDRLAFASTPEEFSSLALGIGLVLSPRSARRIMDGEISPLSSAAEEVRITGADERAGGAKRRKPGRPRSEAPDVKDTLDAVDARTLKIAPEDRDAFLAQVIDAYRALARAYYLDDTVQPALRVGKGALTLEIPVRLLR